MNGAAEAAGYLRDLGLERIFRAAWSKVGRFGAGGRLPTADLAPTELLALESLLGERVPQGRPVPLRRLDAALRRSRFACGIEEVVTAWFGPLPESPQAGSARRAAQIHAFLRRVAPTWVAAGVPTTVAEAVLRREFLLARRTGEPAIAALLAAAEAVASVLGDAPDQRGEAALLGILANQLTGDPHAFDAGTVGGRLLLGALEAPPGAGALRRQQVLAGAGIAVDGISSTVAVFGLATPEDAAATAAVEARQILVAPLRHVLRWRLSPETWAGRPVHVLENPPVFEALLERGLPRRACVVCTSGFPSAAAVALLRELARAGAVVHYSGDFDGNGLQIALRILRLGHGRWATWRLAPTDFATSLALARGRPVRAHAERRALETLAALIPTERAEATLAAAAAAVLAAGVVAFEEALTEVLWEDVWVAHTGRPGPTDAAARAITPP